jgi:hypothetical protein
MSDVHDLTQPLYSLAEILRSNLKQNLADSETFSIERELQEDEIDPSPDLGFLVDLPDLKPDGSVIPASRPLPPLF